MNLPGGSVRRPVTTAMVTFVVILLGAVSMSRLQTDLLPDVELPTLSVRTSYEGASPEVMERLVTQIIEEIIATVPGVERMTSESSEGQSSVSVSFGWGTNIDAAAIAVQSKIDDEINELPDDITRPRVNKFDIASFPVVLLGIASDLDPVELNQIVERQLRYRFAQVPGVAQVDLWGGYDREIRVALYADRVRALRVPLENILTALRNANLDAPAGSLEEGRHELTVRAPAEFRSLEQIRETVVALRNGAPVKLRQIAKIEDTYTKLSRVIRVNGERGLRVAVRKEANANTVEVAKGILAEVDEINDAFPQLRVIPVINQGNFIERSIQNVAQSVLYGGILGVLILLLFLSSVRSTLVIALAIPISILATFSLLFLSGLTLNLMTLGGLALGVGMMVDSSIVVLENIFRRKRELGETALTASIEGAREVAGAIVASTITTSVVFLPLVFVGGVSGILFRELAYVVIFSLTCSLLVSLTVLPAVASRLLARDDIATDSSKPPSRAQRVLDAANKRLDGWLAHYGVLLQKALARPKAVLLGALALTVASFALLPFIGTEFMPPSDEGEVRINGDMEVGTRLGIVDQQSKKVEALVYPAVPEAVSWVVSVGAGGRSTAASRTDIRLSLTPAIARSRSNLEIAADLRKRLEGAVAGMDIRTRAPQGQFLLERILGGETGLQIEIRGFELDTLIALANAAAQAAESVAGVTDVEVRTQVGSPQHELRVDRAKVADLGLNVRAVADVLTIAIAGAQAGEYREDGDAHRIFVQLHQADEISLDQIMDLPLTSGAEEPVTLRNVVETERSLGPSVIERKNQQRISVVEGNVAGRDLGSVAADLQAKLDGIARPDGYELRVAGDFEEQEKSSRELLISLLLALALVYAVLAAQYESFRNPLVVMLSVPVASIGVLGTLALTATTLNVQSYIGCIMLGGIVVNNAILLVDQASSSVREGVPLEEAVHLAGVRRLRPILMTTLTTLLGLLPLALGFGEGADAQAPMARAVIGGLLASTPMTLLLIPPVYLLLHRKRATS